jgi:hypothetical protein
MVKLRYMDWNRARIVFFPDGGSLTSNFLGTPV